MTTNTLRKPAFRVDDAIIARCGCESDNIAAAVIRADQQRSRERGPVSAARLVSCGVAALLAILVCASSAFAQEHPKDNVDSHFLDTLERPDNAANPARNLAGTFNSRLCCTDQDAVKVDYEMVVSEGGKISRARMVCVD